MVFQFFIGILIIVVAILACVYFYQRRAVKQINDLMESEKKLADQKVDQQIKNVEELQLIGDAKKQFETIKNKYEKQEEKNSNKNKFFYSFLIHKILSLFHIITY